MLPTLSNHKVGNVFPYFDYSTTAPNEAVEATSFGIIPLDEKQCMKQICRKRYFGATPPPDIKPVSISCDDVKSKYIQSLKVPFYQ